MNLKTFFEMRGLGAKAVILSKKTAGGEIFVNFELKFKVFKRFCENPRFSRFSCLKSQPWPPSPLISKKVFKFTCPGPLEESHATRLVEML